MAESAESKNMYLEKCAKLALASNASEPPARPSGRSRSGSAVHVEYQASGDRFRLVFPYEKRLVEAVRAIHGRYFDSLERCWYLPASQENALRLMEIFGLEPSSIPVEFRLPANAEPRILPADVAADLRAAWPEGFEHQLYGLWKLETERRWALFFEAGTGKSAIIAKRIQRQLARTPNYKTLIVCPKTVATVWPGQLARHGGGLSCVMLAGLEKSKFRLALDSLMARADGIGVINYELARIHVTALASVPWNLVVVDESHRVKDASAKTTRALRELISTDDDSVSAVLLTGTPAPNGAIDLFGQFTVLDWEHTFGHYSKTAFRNKYCVMGGFEGRQIVGYRNLEELRRLRAAFSTTVSKAECLDLPPKLFIDWPVKMGGEQHRIYQEIRNHSIARLTALATDEGATLTVNNVLEEILRLLQIVGGFVPSDEGRGIFAIDSCKQEALREIIDGLDPAKQVIIWASFRAEVAAIADELRDCAVHHGGLNQAARAEQIGLFTSGARRFFVATPQSAREGITLVSAHNVIYYSRTYNLLDYEQSMDRAHRIGQTESVSIFRLVCRDSVDEKVAAALEAKSRFQDLITGKSPEEIL